MAIEDWNGETLESLIAMYCPKCSGLHEFARADGILMRGGRFARHGGPRLQARALAGVRLSACP